MTRASRAREPERYAAEVTSGMINTVDYEQRGFVIVRGILDGPMLTSLQSAADRFVRNVRSVDGFTDVNRFDLVDPRLKPYHEYELLNCLDAPEVLGVSERISGGQLKGTSYYINVDTPSMYWHQDFEFLPNELPAAFDLEAFCQQTPFSQIQWNLALFDDTALMVVPGTHRQALSPKQREVLASSGQQRAYIESMPGALRVELKAGDGVAYNSNIVHGVDNPRRVKRRTLHWFWVIWGRRRSL